MSGRRQPGAVPFGEDWIRFAKRKSDRRRLAFFDTFLKAAEGWVPDETATEDELDDYDRIERLLSSYLIGKSGGRPKKETPSETPSETLKKEGRKEGKKETTTGRQKLPPTIGQFLAMAVKAGVPEDFAKYLHGELESCGWTDAKGLDVDNPVRYLKSAWNAEQKKIRAARVGGDDAFGGIRVG